MSRCNKRFLRRLLRDKEAKFFSVPRNVLADAVSARISDAKKRKAEAKRRFKAELAELRSSWEASVAEIASHFLQASPEAALFLSLAKPKSI